MYKGLVLGVPAEGGFFMFWPPSGIFLALILRRGVHLSLGILMGCLVAQMLMISSMERALIYALDDAIFAALAGLLMRRFWPVSHPLVSSVRFFLIMLFAGGVVPSLITSLPTCLLIAEARFGADPFWIGYVQWCLGEIKSVLVLTPLMLLLTRKEGLQTHLSRPWELVVFILIGITIITQWVIPSMADSRNVITSIAGWGLTILTAFLVVIRCGVGGIILGNVALAIVVGKMQVNVAYAEGLTLSDALLVGFHAEAYFVLGLILIAAGGLYDYKRAEQAIHDISASILTTQEDERRRLSSNLHDGAVQTITSALMHLAHDSQYASDKEVQQVIQRIRHGIQELRDTIKGLRPEMLEQSSFADVLSNHCRQVEAQSEANIFFSDRTNNLIDSLPIHIREHLFRLAQEAITNALHHGHAETVTLKLTLGKNKPDWIRMEIKDDGEGFDITAAIHVWPHMGLRIMQERALLIKAKLKIISEQETGTQIIVDLPIPRSDSI
jgi:two-component system NarL family sensor kinase